VCKVCLWHLATREEHAATLQVHEEVRPMVNSTVDSFSSSIVAYVCCAFTCFVDFPALSRAPSAVWPVQG
jgi:hypothetical protein